MYLLLSACVLSTTYSYCTTQSYRSIIRRKALVFGFIKQAESDPGFQVEAVANSKPKSKKSNSSLVASWQQP